MQLKRTVKLKLEVDLQSVLPTIDSVTKAFIIFVMSVGTIRSSIHIHFKRKLIEQLENICRLN